MYNGYLFGVACNQLLLNNPLLDDHPVMESITPYDSSSDGNAIRVQ